ncbi:SDR family NAD(P)-dependent oxidoreductase [Acidocella sp.]|jgi:NAD(P)-dependent dehydrogenase (short-subunit alcohol dehydrogenase family)|uniref:SDR family NAD(P)-dependent oxidoreductase n=1 Tax=Acidocella sp. TaxID=50710 RepID=UPI002F416BD0
MTSPVVLITGALSGIGRATALAYAKQGARLVVSGRRAAEGEALSTELHAIGAEAVFFQADVRHEAEVSALFTQTLARFGGVDIVVNNAGTEGRTAPLTEITPEDYEAVFETNVRGTLLGTKHALRAMQAQGAGSIVNISSTMGSRGAANMALYTASKHAVEGLTKSAAIEAAAYGVRVNAVAPGPTETAMLDRLTGGTERKAAFAAGLPMKRLGTAEEVAAAILFVASEQAGFITGEIIHVNGGKTAS